MISDVTRPEQPFDVVIVHSFSRFFRDAYLFEFYRRKLAKHGVEIVSITQELGNDPMADMVRQILNVFDEYQSKENSKHVRRTMIENARQGFWNGSIPPFGYRTVEAGMRGDTVKKKLGIEPSEAAIVRQVFDLYLQGSGIRAVAATLNDKGLRHRNGRTFYLSQVHEILGRTNYSGQHFYNKTDSKSKKKRPPEEWIEMASPVIIQKDTFDKVQEMLKQRNRTKTAPRIVNGPTLLAGLAKCGTCGCGMTISTGKGGRYKYYACNTRMNYGTCSCKGQRIPMKRLDDLVVDQFSEKVLSPARLEKLISKLVERRQSTNDTSDDEKKTLNKELRGTQTKIDRLYDSLAEGMVENSADFQAAISRQKQRKDELIRQILMLGRTRDIPKDILSMKNVGAFTETIRDKLQDPDSDFCKKYLRLFIDRIEVDEQEIRISGPRSALVGGLLETTKPDTAEEVPGFVQEWWWTQSEANSSPRFP
jgi:site-specific DNA recombinase